MPRPVALLTDYGPATEHVGAMHAVLVRDCPGVVRIDLAHDIPPGDIRWGATVLAGMAQLVSGGVLLAVVDPGVGTDRRGIAVELADGTVAVGPDNGLLSRLAEPLRAVSLHTPPQASATFHGRDVFAPAAARLALGEAVDRLGTHLELADLQRPEWGSAEARPGEIDAVAIGVDRFGNVVSDGAAATLRAARLVDGDRVVVRTAAGTAEATVGRTFVDVPVGALLLYIDAAGHLAIAERGGDAAAALFVGSGDRLQIRGT